MVLQAMQAVGASRSGTVLVGDTSYDMEMARAAGARAIGVSWGYHSVQELATGGRAPIIGHFDELFP